MLFLFVLLIYVLTYLRIPRPVCAHMPLRDLALCGGALAYAGALEAVGRHRPVRRLVEILENVFSDLHFFHAFDLFDLRSQVHATIFLVADAIARVLLPQVVINGTAQNITPTAQEPCSGSAWHAFDFWLGSWVVMDVTSGSKIAQARIEPYLTAARSAKNTAPQMAEVEKV